MGEILCIAQYLIAAILLYTIIFGTYDRDNKRYKRPVWFILVSIILVCIPVINLFAELAYFVFESELVDERVYHKSFLTKRI